MNSREVVGSFIGEDEGGGSIGSRTFAVTTYGIIVRFYAARAPGGYKLRALNAVAKQGAEELTALGLPPGEAGVNENRAGLCVTFKLYGGTEMGDRWPAGSSPGKTKASEALKAAGFKEGRSGR